LERTGPWANNGKSYAVEVVLQTKALQSLLGVLAIEDSFEHDPLLGPTTIQLPFTRDGWPPYRKRAAEHNLGVMGDVTMSGHLKNWKRVWA
jgi:hypothetical protein